jgi:hypothetical protein
MILSRPKSELIPRMKAIRLDFNRRYSSRSCGALRQELFDAQSGFCPICKKQMQSADSVVAQIDHAVSIFLYATWDYPIEVACKHANRKGNFILAHAACNSAKGECDLDEFEAPSLGEPKKWTRVQIEKMREAMSERSRIQGQRNVENGHLASIRTKENCAKGGRRNVESGQIYTIATKETCSKAGRIGGQRNVESGHIQALGRKAAESGHLASISIKGGRRNVESGHIQSLGRKAVASGHLARISTKGSHLHWHVRRNRSTPRCSHCIEEGLVVAWG